MSFMNLKILFSVIVVYSILGFISTETFSDRMSTIDSQFKLIKDQTAQSYSNMCSSCSVCSYHSCSINRPSDRGCAWDIGDYPRCLNCKRGRMIETSNASTVIGNRFSSPSLTDAILRQNICLTSNVEKTMFDVYNNVEWIKWTKLSTSAGVQKVVVGGVQCGTYDPRADPTYIAAATGRKNVVLLIDTSNFVNASELKLIKSYAKQIVNLLQTQDRILVLRYSNTVEGYNSTLDPATSDLRAKANNYIDGLSLNKTGAGADLNNALSFLYDRLSASKSNNTINANSDILIFLVSSGKYNGNEKTINNTIDFKESQLKFSQKIIYISSIIGTDAPESFFTSIYCQKFGIMNISMDEDDVNSNIGSVVQFLTYTNNSFPDTTLWTDWWDNTGELGQVITAAQPIYDKTTSPPFLIGVASIDVRLSDFSEYTTSETDYTTLVPSFQQNNPNVPFVMNLNNCQLEDLRSYKCLNPNQYSIQCNSSTPLKTSFSKCSVSYSTVFCEDKSSMVVSDDLPNDLTCCRCIAGSPKGAIIAGYIVLFAIVVLIVAAIIYWCCCKEKEHSSQEKIHNYSQAQTSEQNKKEENQSENKQQ